MSLKILQIPVGPLDMNATLVMDEESKETIFCYDPGDEIENNKFSRFRRNEYYSSYCNTLPY